MAHREALQTIRAARAGHASAQLELGKRYLFGRGGVPKNSASALYWLDRAAQQKEEDAWALIGSYIPFETAQYSANVRNLTRWYQCAFEAGDLQAGIVLAKLVLAHAELLCDSKQCAAAREAIRAGAEAGHEEALWLWAQVCRGEILGGVSSGHAELESQERKSHEHNHEHKYASEAWCQWAEKAAEKGVEAARHALVEDAWSRQDYCAYLKWMLLPAKALLQAAGRSSRILAALSEREVLMLKRCARALEVTRQMLPDEIQAFWEAAAQAGDAEAQFIIGLFLAKMDQSGQRADTGAGRVVYKKALRWLNQAAKNGMTEAYYIISKIYLKPEFSQRNSVAAQHYLQQAAQAGHVLAQLEWGGELWRRRGNENNEDVKALYWFSQAASQGNEEAAAWIRRIAGPDSPQDWARQAHEKIIANRRRQPSSPWPLTSQYMAARVELALHFGLSRAEALVLDVKKADCGHCLVVDIRDYHPRSKRRLIVIRDERMRQMVSRIRHLFSDVDNSEIGPEGNYRRRLYRLKSMMGQEQEAGHAVPGVITRSRLQRPSLPGRSF